MPHILDCEITLHQEVAPGHYRMVLHAPAMAKEALAGQFCMLQVQQGLYPFLRRPMCFERVFKDSVSILYKVEGEGTRLMAQLQPGQQMNVQGPLGQPFKLDPAFDRHILVAGGIGVAPFPALAEALIGRLGKTPEVIIAARNERLIICDKDFQQMGCKVYLATDDGTAGVRGFASDVLQDLAPDAKTAVYCCGPMPMMKATHNVCLGTRSTCFASLEAEMACGDGVCLGCVVEANVEIEAQRMVRVCYDGPVFDSRLINWERY